MNEVFKIPLLEYFIKEITHAKINDRFWKSRRKCW